MPLRLPWHHFLLLTLTLWGSMARAAEVVVWHGYRAAERSALEKVVAAYNAARKDSGTQVSLRAIPSDAFTDKVSAAVPRGQGPDVFVFPQDRLGGWVEGGNMLEPLDFFLEPDTRKQFLPGLLDAMTYRGTVYGLPLNFKVLTLIYNKKLVSQPPRTTGELLAWCKQQKPQSGAVCLAYPYTDFYYHAALMNAFGGGVFDPGPKAKLNAPENVRAMELLMRWVGTRGLLPAEPSTALITSLFNEGKAAFVFSGPWFLGEIASTIDYGLAPLPTVDEAGGKPMRPWMTVEGAGVSALSKNKEAALAKDERLNAFRAQAQTAFPMPNLAEMTMVWSPMTTAMNAITRKAATPKAALDEAQRAVQKDMAGLRGNTK